MRISQNNAVLGWSFSLILLLGFSLNFSDLWLLSGTSQQYMLSESSVGCFLADIDNSGTVDLDDLGSIREECMFKYTDVLPECEIADVDSSGFVDIQDLRAVQNNLFCEVPENCMQFDADSDNDIDWEDRKIFESCVYSSNTACLKFDSDSDNDVDSRDKKKFADCFSGNKP
ncbi:MAG: hypothetical protein JW772_02945 [Candidatus Diapherotrites archaeon]|nr:hypothetical protein [Candidatus Diapherotrites archaeon]